MDVITILRPENDIVPNSFAAAETGFEFRIPFPYVFLLMISLLVAVSPVLQGRYGFYRLDRLEFTGASGADTALRSSVFPDRASATVASDTAAALPDSVKAVTYSTYKVRGGETLSSIASRFGLKNVSTLLSVNAVDNAKRIHVGQSLSVPSMDGIIYIVRRGDSLGRVASSFSTQVVLLLDANDLSSETLSVGQKLFIPGGTLSTMDLRRALGELFVVPVKGRLTSRYGYRSDPFTGVRSFHTGIDLAASTGTSVKATLDGTVATTGFSNVYGNYIIITHGGNYQSLYGHLSAISVKRGQNITQGAIIGKVGSTGYSTGPHLHFSVYKNSKLIDPYSVLN